MNLEHTDYYKSNLALLKKHHVNTWIYITENPPMPIGDISFAPNGNPNLTVTNKQRKSILFHDKTNPEKESSDFLNKVPKDHKGFIAILGMGLCYSALKILKERPHLQRLALFELEPGIFIQALLNVDLSSILKDDRVTLCIGKKTKLSETLDKASRTIQLEDSNTYHHYPSFDFNPEGYNQLKDDLFSYINGLNVGGTTTRLLGKAFLNNRFKNISTIHHHLLLEQIHYKFDGKPAILVAGGPSLNKNIQLLKQVQEKAVIIAVDTVLPALLKNGVHPHFLTCIDPYDLTYEKLADVASKVKDTALICASWVTSKAAKIFPADQVFWTFTRQPMEAWINSMLGGKIFTGGASTVAHLNMIAAQILGCDPIIFIGQDLAYADTDSASHAKGTILQGTTPTSVIENPFQSETVTGIHGEILKTDRSFLSMKKFFETAISASDRTYINATEGGANIEGTRIQTLQEAIDKNCTSQINTTQCLKKFYSTAKPINPDKMIVEFKKMIDKTKSLQRTIKKSDTITTSLIKDLIKIKKSKKPVTSFEMLSSTQKKQIIKIDKHHQTLDDTLEVWKMLEEITMEGLKESERRKQDISILENNPDKFIDWLLKGLDQRIKINKTRKETLALLASNLNMITSFHQKEYKHLKQNKLKLADLYINSENYHLAKPLLEELLKTIPESGEVHFYLGCIAMQYNLLEEAHHYFQSAIIFNPKLSRHIDSYIQKLGDTFMTYATYFKTEPGRELSVKYLVQKGLTYHPEHSGLKVELETILKNDLKKIKSDIDTDNYQNSAQLINEWHQNAMDQKNLFKDFPPELVSHIYLYKGKLFLSQKDYQNALKECKSAMEYSPDDHEIHTVTIDTLFLTGDLNGAIKALNTAIKLNNQFAAYWETIGDSLQHANQNEDAILAYETCFIHLPDNINLLKKIGDCYMETNQLEAARAAYQQLKIRAEGLNGS